MARKVWSLFKQAVICQLEPLIVFFSPDTRLRFFARFHPFLSAGKFVSLSPLPSLFFAFFPSFGFRRTPYSHHLLKPFYHFLVNVYRAGLTLIPCPKTSIKLLPPFLRLWLLLNPHLIHRYFVSHKTDFWDF